MILRDMNILNLNVHRMWFDMIASGEKKEEYRSLTEYWDVRLLDGFAVKKFTHVRLYITKKTTSITVILNNHENYNRIHNKSSNGKWRTRPCLVRRNSKRYKTTLFNYTRCN